MFGSDSDQKFFNAYVKFQKCDSMTRSKTEQKFEKKTFKKLKPLNQSHIHYIGKNGNQTKFHLTIKHTLPVIIVIVPQNHRNVFKKLLPFEKILTANRYAFKTFEGLTYSILGNQFHFLITNLNHRATESNKCRQYIKNSLKVAKTISMTKNH